MPQRRSLPASRRPHRRAVLAVGAVGALVLVPASGAIADDAVPPEGDDATQPLPDGIELPEPGGEDQVTGGPAVPDGDGAPDGDAPVVDDAAPPALSADPALVADQAIAPVEPYMGAGKQGLVTAGVSADGADPSQMVGAQVRVESDMENPSVGVYEVVADGTIGTTFVQDIGETLTFTLVAPPPGYMATAVTTEVVEPCDIPTPPGAFTELGGAAASTAPGSAPACITSVVFDVVPQYRTVQLRAVTAAGVPVPGVAFELHSPLAPVGRTSVGGGTAAVVLPGRTLIGASVTAADGVAALGARVAPGADYLVVPTGVPDGYMLPPSIRLDLSAVDSVAEADVPVVMEFRLVPALAATGASPWPLGALAAGFLATGGGLVVLRRRMETVAG